MFEAGYYLFYNLIGHNRYAVYIALRTCQYVCQYRFTSELYIIDIYIRHVKGLLVSPLSLSSHWLEIRALFLYIGNEQVNNSLIVIGQPSKSLFPDWLSALFIF